MATEISKNLYIATVEEIKTKPGTVFVNLASSYHYQLHNWSHKLHYQNHACYVICTEMPHSLSVNWVDANDPSYFDYNGRGVEVMLRIFEFIDKHIKSDPVYLVCNKAESRSPSVAMTYLASQEFPKPTLEVAKAKFVKLYPSYAPGTGISQFLSEHWDEL